MKLIFNEIIKIKELNCKIQNITCEFPKCPQQRFMSNDCGVFMICFMELLLLEKKNVNEFDGNTKAYRLKLKNLISDYIEDVSSLPQI